MFKPISSYSGFSVSGLERTKEFYSKILGLKVDQNPYGLELNVPSGEKIFMYHKDQHTPATYTVLNFIVENIDQSLAELEQKGVKFQQYNREDMPQDEKGVLRGLKTGMGPDIAWFEDPSRNILSIIQEK